MIYHIQGNIKGRNGFSWKIDFKRPNAFFRQAARENAAFGQRGLITGSWQGLKGRAAHRV